MLERSVASSVGLCLFSASAFAQGGNFRLPIRILPRDESLLSRTPPPAAITPAQMTSIYGVSKLANQGAGQTIALVLWYDDPKQEDDLGKFDTYYGLPACTTANGCFTKIYANGRKPLANPESAAEMALDCEWAHAIAPQAKIIQVEASSATNANLENAIQVAVQNGATIVSMSFGGSEFSGEAAVDSIFQAPGVTYIASSGDSNHGVSWPSSSPYVIGVGGTSLTHSGGTYESETVWYTSKSEGTGGGISTYEPEPSYQVPFQNYGSRGVPDLAWDADPNTGVAIYCTLQGGWVQVGGTSMGSPEIAGLFAIIQPMRASSGKGALTFPADVYSFTADYHDITTGSNGTCGALCNAGPGYDFETGVGTPIANVLVPALVGLP